MSDSNKTGGVLVTPPPKLAQHLDWLEITYPILGQKVNISYPEHWSKTRVECKPRNGYNLAVRYADGRIEELHTEHQNMGVHVTFPAQTLAELKEDEKWLLEYLLTEGAKVTRLDCAIDVLEYPLDFDVLWSLIKSREYKCRIRQSPLRIHDATHGDTIYFGRMKSSVFTRLYNKQAEQKTEFAWVRVETVFRHSRANDAAKKMVKTNSSPASFVTGHVQIPRSEWWTDVMTMQAVKTRLNRSDGDKRREWLMKSVAPTLAKEMFLHPETWDEFRAVVFDCLETERQKLDKTLT